MVGTALFLIPTLISFAYPLTAHAGLFSFLVSAFESPSVSAAIPLGSTSPNSQTIALLQAIPNEDPTSSSTSDIVPIQGNQTLVADSVITDPLLADGPVNTQVSIYVIREGDTLSSIAKLFGVSVNTILWANSDAGVSRSQGLKVGQTLVILPVSGINYVVRKGDTIKKIVSKYKADLGEVLEYNDLTIASDLSVGQTIVIPDVELQVSIPTKMKVNLNEPLFGTNVPEYPGYYIRPIDGGYESQGLHGYNAVDLAAPRGTPVHASAAGTVIISNYNNGWHGGYGNYIVISHSNGTQTLYAHLSKNTVHAGDYVSQGQTIGLLGSTGNSTGPHVHFEVRGAHNPF